jgi:hypothetical protein
MTAYTAKRWAPIRWGNLLVHDTWGAHQRMVIARKDITELNAIAPENWEAPESYIRVVHSVFPNLSISAILGGQCLIGFVYPGETSTTTCHSPAHFERRGSSNRRRGGHD